MILVVLGALLFSVLDTAIISTLSPVWRAENIITNNLRDKLASLRSKESLVRENSALKEQLSSLEIKLSLLAGQSNKENELLALLGRRPEGTNVAAGVLIHPPQTPYDMIIIDAGSKESIQAGAKVLLPEGPIIGEILEVFPNSARAVLYSASGEENAAVLERNNVPVTLKGIGSGNFKIKLPRDVGVEIGDRILSPDLDSSLFAVVEDIEIKSTDSFKEVLARSPANIFELRFVFIKP